MEKNIKQSVAVIGAGPAGLYAADYLAKNGVHVALINRDIKYGGLAEFGIYHDKHKMKNGLRKQFQKITESQNIRYFGNLEVGESKHLTINALQEMGFSAVLVTVGAQGTKWLGLPGEDLKGVYHAKDLVYHYNQLPPFSTQNYPIGNKVIIIGVGNVMLDIAAWTIHDLQTKQVTAIARRGPADVKFTKKELGRVFNNLNKEAFEAEMERVKPNLSSIGLDTQEAREFILSSEKFASETSSDTEFNLNFLQQPNKIIGDEDGNVIALEVEKTGLKLRPDGKGTQAFGLGTYKRIPTDTVIFCIGDRVDHKFGLPLDKWGEFAKSPNPSNPEGGLSYEAYDFEIEKSVEGVFLAGWAREASSGLVGTARKDGINGAKALLESIKDQSSTMSPETVILSLYESLASSGEAFVSSEDVKELTRIETSIANEKNLEHYKFSTNQEMLAAIGLLKPA